MKRGKKQRYFRMDVANRKYRLVLLLSYSMIAVLTIIILISGIFLWFNVHTQKIIYDMSMGQLRNLDTVFSNSLSMYRTQLQTAWQDTDVRQYIYTTPDGWENEYLVGNYFAKMCVNNGIADYVCLFKGNDFHFYGPYYPESGEREQIEHQIRNTENDMQQFYIQDGSDRKLCIFLTERSTIGDKPQSGIIYVLDLKRLERQLIAQNNANSVYLAFSSDGKQVLTGKLSENNCESVWKWLIENGEKTNNRKITIDGIRYLCNCLYDGSIGIYFVMIQDYQIMQEQIQGMMNASVICVIGSLFLALVLSVFLANRIYYPLDEFFRKLKFGTEMLPENENYSRLQTETTSEKIISQIHMLSQQYHTDEVLKFLNGEAEEKIPLILRLSDREEEGRFLMLWTEKRNLQGNLTKLLTASLEARLAGCKLTSFHDTRSPWILFLIKEPIRLGRLADDTWIEKQIKDSCTDCYEKEEKRIYYALSPNVMDEKELRRNFLELQTLQKYHLLGRSGSGMKADQFTEKEKREIPPKIYEKYLSILKKGNTDEAIRLLPQILNILSEYEIHQVLLSLAGFCVSMEQGSRGRELTGRERQEKYLEHYIRLTALYDRQELEKYLKNITEETGLENSVLQEKTLRMNMLDAVEYIREHYRDDSICMDQVAERFHMSVSYFSKLFNEYVGMTFPEFINDLRLTYAKELLQANRNISIKKIAEICGFGTTSYFSQQFKKKFGVSPSAVKNQ